MDSVLIFVVHMLTFVVNMFRALRCVCAVSGVDRSLIIIAIKVRYAPGDFKLTELLAISLDK